MSINGATLLSKILENDGRRFDTNETWIPEIIALSSAIKLAREMMIYA